MLIASKYLRPVGVGITSPRLFKDIQGKIYVVKLMQNPLGSKVLVNELMANLIGQYLSLSFPPADVIKVGAGRYAGLHFASAYLSHAVYASKKNISKTCNISDLAGILLFDQLFFNYDRTLNRKNLLIARDGDIRRLYAIDNSHLFKQGKWDKTYLKKIVHETSVNTRRLFGVILKHYLSPEDFTPFLQRIGSVDGSEIAKIISALPEEWLADIEERKALMEFISIRLSRASEITERLCALIPDKNRRAHID